MFIQIYAVQKGQTSSAPMCDKLPVFCDYTVTCHTCQARGSYGLYLFGMFKHVCALGDGV